MQFGRRVRELREQRDWTQKELADRLDVSVSYISKVENERLHFGDFPSVKFFKSVMSRLPFVPRDALRSRSLEFA